MSKLFMYGTSLEGIGLQGMYKMHELADKELIDDITFKAIINSSLINRYGIELFLITK